MSESARELAAALGTVAGPLPGNDAPDSVWDAWVEAEEFESAVAGVLSQLPRPRVDDVEALRTMLGAPTLRSRLGEERLRAAEALVQALSHGL